MSNNSDILEILEEEVMEERSPAEETVTVEILCENSDPDNEIEPDIIVTTINLSPAAVEIATITRTNTNDIISTSQVSPSSDCSSNQTIKNTNPRLPNSAGSTPGPSSPKIPRLNNSKSKEKNASTSNNITVRAVLNDDYTTDIPLIDMIIANITERREASILATRLPKLPQNLSHLKRIRSRQGLLQILICPPSDDPEDPVKNVHEILLEASGGSKNYFQGLDTTYRTSKVPSRPPLTRFQFNTVNTFWPCNFHPDKDIEKLLTKDCGFSPEEKSEIIRNFEYLFTIREMYDNRPSCLIYDPADGAKEIISVSSGAPKEKHPIQHAAIAAIDGVARLQGGSVCQLPDIPSDDFLASVSSKRTRTEHSDYLCTGLDAYLINEPCVMCAMALLHCRTKRIFFAIKSPDCGALESIVKLQCMPGINHRYLVFHVENFDVE